MDVHSDGKRHRQVSHKAKEGVVDGLVKEEVVSEFVASKVQRVVNRASPDVGEEDDKPP